MSPHLEIDYEIEEEEDSAGLETITVVYGNGGKKGAGKASAEWHNAWAFVRSSMISNLFRRFDSNSPLKEEYDDEREMFFFHVLEVLAEGLKNDPEFQEELFSWVTDDLNIWDMKKPTWDRAKFIMKYCRPHLLATLPEEDRYQLVQDDQGDIRVVYGSDY